MGTIRDMLNSCTQLLELVREPFMASSHSELHSVIQLLESIQQSPVYSLLNTALAEVESLRSQHQHLPLSLSNGSFIKEGYSQELDEWRKIDTDNQSLLKDLQIRYQQETENPKVKVKWNDSLGFYLETPITSPLTDTSRYFPCQLLKSHYRYKTNELSSLDHKRYQATEMIRRIEVLQSLRTQ